MNNPKIFYQGNYTLSDLEDFRKSNRIWREKDIFGDQLSELFEINHPDKIHSVDKSSQEAEFLKQKIDQDPKLVGNWVYYPSSGKFIHTVNEEDYFQLRTNRNKYLITQEEQNHLYNSTVAFAGLSIGSHFAVGLAYSGIAKNMKFAEFDTLSTSNLNRIRLGLSDIGESKLDLVAESVYEINPYVNLVFYPQGLDARNLANFLEGERKADMVFEAIDDFEMKIRLRLLAREKGIPVIMLTNLEDKLMIDIERYDLDPKLPLFNGIIGDTPEEILNTTISEKEKVKFAIKIVGINSLTTRILKTLFEINKTIVGRPQLYSTVTIGGGFAAYLARRLLLGKELNSGRIILSFDNLLGYKGNNQDDERSRIVQQLRDNFGV